MTRSKLRMCNLDDAKLKNRSKPALEITKVSLQDLKPIYYVFRCDNGKKSIGKPTNLADIDNW